MDSYVMLFLWDNGKNNGSIGLTLSLIALQICYTSLTAILRRNSTKFTNFRGATLSRDKQKYHAYNLKHIASAI